MQKITITQEALHQALLEAFETMKGKVGFLVRGQLEKYKGMGISIIKEAIIEHSENSDV